MKAATEDRDKALDDLSLAKTRLSTAEAARGEVAASLAFGSLEEAQKALSDLRARKQVLDAARKDAEDAVRSAEQTVRDAAARQQTLLEQLEGTRSIDGEAEQTRFAEADEKLARLESERDALIMRLNANKRIAASLDEISPSSPTSPAESSRASTASHSRRTCRVSTSTASSPPRTAA